MIVVSHQTVGNYPDIPHLNTGFEKINKGIIVPFICEYLLAPHKNLWVIKGFRNLKA